MSEPKTNNESIMGEYTVIPPGSVESFSALQPPRPWYEDNVENWENLTLGEKALTYGGVMLEGAVGAVSGVTYAAGAGLVQGTWNLAADGLNLVTDGVPTISDEEVNALGAAMPLVGDYYSRNKEILTFGGDMVGLFVGGGAAIKALNMASRGVRAAGYAENAGAVGMAARALTVSEYTHAAMRAAYTQSALTAARAGGITAGNAALRSQRLSNYGTIASNVFKQNLAFDLGAYALYNDSSVSTGSLTQDLALGAAFGLIPMGAEISYAAWRFRGIAGKAAEAAAKARDPANLYAYFNETVFRPGARDVGIATYAAMSEANRRAIAELSEDSALGAAGMTRESAQRARQVLSADKVQYDSVVLDQLRALGTDTQIGSMKVSMRSEFTTPELNTLKLFTETNPASMLGFRFIENMPHNQSEMTARLASFEKLKADKIAARDEVLEKLQGLLGQDLSKIQADEKAALLAKLRPLNQEVRELNKLDFLVLEADGSVTAAAGRKSRGTDDPNFEASIVKESRMADAESLNYRSTKIKGLVTSNDGFVTLPYSMTRAQNLGGASFISKVVNGIETAIPIRGHAGLAENNQRVFDTLNSWAAGLNITRDLSHIPAGTRQALSNAVNGDSTALNALIGSSLDLQSVSQQFGAFRTQLLESFGDANDNTITAFALRPKGANKQKLSITDAVGIERLFVVSDDAVKAATKSKLEVFPVTVPINRVIMPAKDGMGRTVLLAQRASGVADGRVLTINSSNAVGRASGYTQLNHNDAFTVLGQMQHTLQKLTDKQLEKIGELHLAGGDHWLRSDYLLGVLDKFGDKALNQLRWQGQGIGDMKAARDMLTWNSLRSKYKDFLDYRHQIAKRTDNDLSLYDLEGMLNLPRGIDAYHPTMLAFESLYLSGVDTLESGVKNLDHFKQLMGESASTSALSSSVWQSAELDMRGFFMRPLDEKNITKPVLAVREQMDRLLVNETAIKNMANSQRLEVFNAFTSIEGRNTLAGQLFEILANSAATAEAAKLERLGEGMTTSRIWGMGSHAMRDSPTLLAAQQLSRQLQQMTEKVNGNILTRKIYRLGEKLVSASDIWGLMQTKAAAADRIAFNAFASSRRLGWDIEGLSQLDNATRFTLKANANNLRIARAHGFNKTAEAIEAVMKSGDEDAVTGVFMPHPHLQNGTDVPLAVTELAAQAIKGLDDYNRSAFDSTAVIAKAAGKRIGIGFKDYWVPPPLLRDGEFAAFLVDGHKGKNHLVVAKSQTELDNLVKLQSEQMRANGARQVDVYTKKETEMYGQLWDQALHGLINYTDTLAQTGRGMTGATGRRFIDDSADILTHSISAINKNFQAIPHRVLSLYLEPQVQKARLAAKAGGTKLGAPFQDWLREIQGQNLIDSSQSGLATIYRSLETGFDRAMLDLYDRHGIDATNLKKGLSSLAGKVKSVFKSEPEAPVQNIVDGISRDWNVEAPKKLREIMGDVNGLATNLALRWVDAAQGVMNAIGTIVNYPALIQEVQRMRGESQLEHLTRIGAYGEALGTQGMARISTPKLFTGMMNRMFNDLRFKELMAKADKAGMLTPEYHELNRSLFAPTETFAQQTMRKIGDASSIISDKSEEFARTLMFGTWVHYAESALKLKRDEDIIAFANRWTDRSVGNYSMRNKPLIFQGAVGMPLGSFQTYLWNFYSRLFQMVEHKQYRALGVQYGMQASMFGLQSVPGYDVFSGIMTSVQGERDNPVDALNRMLLNQNGQRDPATAYWTSDILQYGAVSWLSQMAFYSRGDSNISRVPTLMNPLDAASLSIIGRIAQGFHAAWDANTSTLGLEDSRTLEIIANYSPSRPLRGIIELGLGYSTDKAGQVINEDTRDALSVAARLAGLKPLYEARAADAYIRDKAAQAQDRERRRRLNDAVGSKIRTNDFKENDLADAWRGFYNSGGRPEYFGKWMNEQMMQANQNRNWAVVKDRLTDPRYGVPDALRLLQSERNYR